MLKQLTTLLIMAFFATVLYATDDWTQKNPSPKPSAREMHAASYITFGKSILFGGDDGSLDDETWIYDLSEDSWTNKSPLSKPSARQCSDIAYIEDDKVLLFGGQDSGPLPGNNETWIYDLSDNTWTQKSPISKPSARSYHRMAYIGDDKVLLFGGYDGTYDDETWVYDLSDNNWSQKNPTTKPSARHYHDMAYIGGDKVLLFGGYVNSNYNDETWIYDLSDNTWIQQNPTSKPSGRVTHTMAYIGVDQVLLFGGKDGPGGGGFNVKTWIYDLSDDNWLEDANTTQPQGRSGHTLSETSMDGSSYPVLFGGDNGVGNLDDTWSFGGGDYPIPVELTSFIAKAVNGEVILSWSTATETENLGYHVYRCLNEDLDYAKISQELIKGAGSSDQAHSYSYTDPDVEAGNTYYYKLADVDFNGNTTFHGPISVTVDAVTPTNYALEQSYPNPFNPETAINFSIKEAGKVSLKIYNLQGQLIRSLVEEDKLAGSYSVIWNGTNDKGIRVSSGTYLYTLKVNGFEETKKLTFMK